MKWKSLFPAAVMLAALLITPASALDYTIDAPGAGDFGAPTSDNTVYVGAENTVNVDRSKNSALIPPGFGTPTSYLPGSGELLTPNLAGSGGAVSVVNPSGGGIVSPSGGSAVYPGADSADNGGSIIYPGTFTGTGIYSTAYTSVTSDLYYSGGYLGTLKIPALGLSVKVYQGTDTATLAKGAGHFPDTSIWDGNICIAGHNRGTNCYFGEIHTLSAGDRITMTTKLGTRTYSVTSVQKISETDNSMLSATAENCITLFTCVRDQSAFRWCVRAVEI